MIIVIILMILLRVSTQVIKADEATPTGAEVESSISCIQEKKRTTRPVYFCYEKL